MRSRRPRRSSRSQQHHHLIVRRFSFRLGGIGDEGGLTREIIFGELGHDHTVSRREEEVPPRARVGYLPDPGVARGWV